MWPEIIKNEVYLFLDQWFRAEEALKRTERLRNEAIMASIQELRYAGRRFVHALQTIRQKEAENIPLSNDSPEIDNIKRDIIEATENCIKARHDAMDSAVCFVHNSMDKLVEEVGLNTVKIHFPQFNLLANEIKEIDKKIVFSRGNRDTIEEQYDEILQKHIDKLLNFFDLLSDSEEAIRASLIAQKKKEKKNHVTSFLIGAASSAVIALLFLVGDVQIKGFLKLNPQAAQTSTTADCKK